MSEQVYRKNFTNKNIFWVEATKYTSTHNGDDSFVNELAYVMVTLHRTGA